MSPIFQFFPLWTVFGVKYKNSLQSLDPKDFLQCQMQKDF